MLKLRTEALRWGVGTYCATLGACMLVAPHQFGKLACQHAFDRSRGYAFVTSILFQEIIEGRYNSALLRFVIYLLHAISLFRLIANSRSPAL